MARKHLENSSVPATQKLFIDRRKIGNSEITFVGVEHEAPHHSYPWENIHQLLESLGENGKIVLEYFPAELEQTIYNHPLLGRYAKRYSRHAGITHFFDKVGNLAARNQHDVIVLDPANNAAFQLLYLHLPLVAIGLGTVWGVWKQRSKQRARRRLLQRFVAGTLVITGLEGVSWYLQDTIPTHPFKRLYRDNALNMRDMRWVTIAQGLIQCCKNDAHHLLVLYPPAQIFDGILHYLSHHEERTKKYTLYSKTFPGITKAIRKYRWESGTWRLVTHEPITVDD